jgi:hypothetical protein
MPAEGCSPETVKLTSVSIDRITGASREKFLYSTRAFTAARFDVILAVERLNEDNESDQAALEVFDSLIDYLTAKDSDGLEIGHGTTTGFGWFDVKRMEEAA